MATVSPSPVHRLAEEARRRGIRILVESITGEHFATSARDEGVIYRLTAYSCSCPGFMRWGHCTHHSLLLAEKGWLPDDDPEPPSTPVAAARIRIPPLRLVTCGLCDGTGQEEASIGYGLGMSVSCWHCGGTGQVARIDEAVPRRSAGRPAQSAAVDQDAA